jgi:hypothetical protein
MLREKKFFQKSVKHNEMCAASWPFYPKVLHFKKQQNKDFSFFLPVISWLTIDPVTTMYIGIRCTKFLRPYFFHI